MQEIDWIAHHGRRRTAEWGFWPLAPEGEERPKAPLIAVARDNNAHSPAGRDGLQMLWEVQGLLPTSFA